MPLLLSITIKIARPDTRLQPFVLSEIQEIACLGLR
jgi:hypothetical protein